jgi:hypothetical protein
MRAEGFRVDPLGTTARCFEVRNYHPTETDPRIVCWEFQAGRSLAVNNESTPCLQNEGSPLGPERADGYCVEVGAGGAEFAGFLFPLR